MKRLILGGLSVLLLSAAATSPAFADATEVNHSHTNNSSNSTATPGFELEPFNLVSMAYQGYFQDQGIPSGQALMFAYRKGDISAIDIVSVGVQSNRITAAMLADDSYVNAVELQMNNLIDNGGISGR